MASRFIHHGIPDTAALLKKFQPVQNPTKELTKSLEKLIAEYPPRDSYDAHECSGLYSGPTSIAYLFLQLSRSHNYLRVLGREPKDWATEYLKGTRAFSPVTAVKNGIGSELLAFHAVHGATYQEDCLDEQKLKANIVPVLDTTEQGSDEWLYGRAGCLYLLRLVLAWKPQSLPILSCMRSKLVDLILDHGPSWPWHGKDYLGAVHGRIGIITQVILSDPSKASHPVIVNSLKETLDLQDADGNWPSSMHSSHHDLVQFCHGAPGFIISLEAIEPHLPFDISLQSKVASAYKKAQKCVEEKGLLTKQPNLCHGISGNALALATPWREAFMHYTTAEAMEELLGKGKYIPGDDPFGLFCGEAGRAWAWLALVSSSERGMIGFSDV